MKIAVVQGSFKELGGAEYLILWKSRELISRGHSVTIITCDVAKHVLDEYKEINFKITNIGFTKNKLVWFLSIFKISKWIKNFDIVNTHNPPTNLIIYFTKIWTKLWRKNFPKIVWYCHEPPANWYGSSIKNVDDYIKNHWAGFNRRYFFLKFGYLLDRIAVQKTDLILTNSKSTKKFVDYCYKEKKIKSYVCYPGVPEHRFTASTKTSFSGYILSVGRMIYHKGYDKLIKALVYLKEKNEKIVVKVVGSGNELEKIKKMAKEHKVNNYIKFLGYVSDKELTKLYRNSNLVILLSMDEPFGLVIMEAMLNKKVFIAHNSGGPSEVITDKENGLLLKNLEPKTIGDTIVKYYKSKPQLSRIGKTAYKYSIKSFTIKYFVDRFLSLLNKKCKVK